MTRCPTCGTTYGDDARFCTRDGTRLVPAPARGAPAAPPAPAAGAPNDGFAEMIGKTLEGRYKIIKKLGEGGMSYVYLAEDMADGNARCAIKILAPALSKDENAMARLRREAELGGRLEHANICHIIRLGETPERLVYIVMPYIEGEILAD